MGNFPQNKICHCECKFYAFPILECTKKSNFYLAETNNAGWWVSEFTIYNIIFLKQNVSWFPKVQRSKHRVHLPLPRWWCHKVNGQPAEQWQPGASKEKQVGGVGYPSCFAVRTAQGYHHSTQEMQAFLSSSTSECSLHQTATRGREEAAPPPPLAMR